MKLLPQRKKAGHTSDSDLTAKDPDEVHEPRERGGKCSTGQGTRFEAFQNDAADEADIRACKPSREEELYDLEAAACPRSVDVRVDPARNRYNRQPEAQNQSRVRVDDCRRDQPDD